MKLDRNIPPFGRGKYALVLLREVITELDNKEEVRSALKTLEKNGVIDYGGGARDFFVIRLKDKFAAPALAAYAMAAYPHDQEYAMEVLNLSKKAAEHPGQRSPD